MLPMQLPMLLTMVFPRASKRWQELRWMDWTT